MIITVKSKIEKGWIRLPKKVRLPDGTRIIVQIEPILKTQEKHKILSEFRGVGLMTQLLCPFLRSWSRNGITILVGRLLSNDPT